MTMSEEPHGLKKFFVDLDLFAFYIWEGQTYIYKYSNQTQNIYKLYPIWKDMWTSSGMGNSRPMLGHCLCLSLNNIALKTSWHHPNPDIYAFLASGTVQPLHFRWLPVWLKETMCLQFIWLTLTQITSIYILESSVPAIRC